MSDTTTRCAEHPPFEADYCPSCGTMIPIGDRPRRRVDLGPTLSERLAAARNSSLTDPSWRTDYR